MVLHQRERQVLLLLAEGLTNDQMAARLFLTRSAVKRRLAKLYRKLDVHDRYEAAEWAQKQLACPHCHRLP